MVTLGLAGIGPEDVMATVVPVSELYVPAMQVVHPDAPRVE